MPTAVTPSANANQSSSGGNAGNQFGQHSRGIGALRTGNRCISQIRSDLTTQDHDLHGSVELDSHAETCTIRVNFRITAYTEKFCNVSPYHPKYEGIEDCPIVQATTVYMDSEIGASYILVINQGMYVKDLENTLINQNQLRMNG
jgi:hypothetical protein